MPLAYFLTFTTYGTWLHGTEKGKGSVDRGHNTVGSDFVPHDLQREQAAQDAMTQPAYTLDAARRSIVRDAIVAISQEKGWQLLAAHARTREF